MSRPAIPEPPKKLVDMADELLGGPIEPPDEPVGGPHPPEQVVGIDDLHPNRWS